jgi:LPS export ABC transporter permease LptG/LPS export ABC transporter permease LptF
MRSPRRLIVARALVREMLPTFLLATSVATFLLLIRSLFFLADLFISHSATLGVAARLLLLGLPNIFALTIPIGVLFAVLMTSARWSADSEIIAAQACGVRLGRLARPLIAAAAGLFLLDAVLTVGLMPAANARLQDLTRKTALSSVRAAVEQGSFTEEFPGHLLYVSRISKDERWHGILLFDLTTPLEERLITADSGEFVQDGNDNSAWLNLSDTTTYVVKPDKPDTLVLNSNVEQRILLQAPAVSNGVIRRGVRETGSAELLRRALSRGGGTTSDRVEALIELHKRLAIPGAALAFALVAFPLGVRNRRGGRGWGLTMSVALVVLYYILLNNGELLAHSGEAPVALGIWLPNLLLVGLAAILFRRVARGVRHERGGRRWRLRSESATLAASGESGERGATSELGPSGCHDDDVAARRPNGLSLPLFSIVDRTLIRQCLSFLLLVMVAVFVIYVAVNLSENLDEIQKNHVPLLVVTSYYAFSLPQILHDIMPLVFLIAFLGTTSVLERHNESTALRAAGVSLARVGAPLLALAVVLGVALFAMDEAVVQRANRTAQRLEDVIKGRKVSRSYRATDKPWLFLPDGRTLVNFLQYDADAESLLRPSIYVFDEHFNLRSLIMARRADYRDGKWIGVGAWSRVPGQTGTGDYVYHKAPVILPIGAPPSYFGREYRKPSEMSFGQLRMYIATLAAAGYRADRLAVQLHQKLAYPLSMLVLGWLALPYAFRMGRRGTIMGIALALVLGMAYFAFTAFITKLGEASLLPPALAAWSPTVVFALLALNRYTTLRT